jgi:deoxycytidylate deaminase
MSQSRRKISEHEVWELAKQLCSKSNVKKFKHAAILVKNGTILSVGVNYHNPIILREFESMFRLGYRNIHAEADCYWRLGCVQKKTAGSTIYVYGENRNGKPTFSKPCASCQALLRTMRVKRVVFHTPNGVEELELRR